MMAQIEQQMPIPVPDLSTLRITTAVSTLGKAYGCDQCSGKLFKVFISIYRTYNKNFKIKIKLLHQSTDFWVI